MNRLSHYLFVVFLLLGTVSFTQQDIHVTMFWNTYLHTNPATAGLFNSHEANALYRNQWDKVNGAPNSLLANYSAKINAIHGGAGVSYTFDAIGFNRQQTILAHYSYHLKLKENILAFGASAGAILFSIDPQWTPPSTLFDPTLPAKSSDESFSANVGVAYHAEKWNTGFSVTNLNAPSFGNDQNGASYHLVRHYYLFGDYHHDFSDRFTLTPRLLLMTDAVKYSFNTSLMGTLDNKFWTGINYRVGDAIGVMAGYNFREQFGIGYNYDLTINKLSSISRGSHEILLSYKLK